MRPAQHAVAHDQICIEAQRRVDQQLVLRGGEQRGQPAALARVGAEEDGVVRAHELEELGEMVMGCKYE